MIFNKTEMRNIKILILIFVLFTTLRLKATSEKPNIVFILIDDLGWKDVSYMGSDYYETPNIDKLASEGVVFTNAYAPAANSAPSRACILSGQYTPRHGVYTVGSSERGESHTRKLIPTPNTINLADSVTTIAEMLKKADYKTISIGKWHVNEDPCSQGFDINIGGSHAGHPKSYFSPYKNPNLKDGPEGEYLTDRLTSEAINFIKENSSNKNDRPFFLYLPYFTVHSPLQGKEHLIDKYKKKEGSPEQQNPVYAAMIESADSNIGRIIKTLEQQGISENTIVIFFSDNGGIASTSSQKPLRAGKGSYYEGGIREPLIMQWPRRFPKGKIIDESVSGIDFYPTILEVANVEKEENQILDGVSLVSLITLDENLKRDALYWHFPIYLGAYNPELDESRDPLFRTRPGSVIRKGNWKLHEYFEDGGLELYNLENDLGEQYNLAEEMPEKVEELHLMLKQWRKDTGAPVPNQLNPDYIENRE